MPGSEITLAPNVSTALAVVASALDPIHRGDRATLELLAAAGVPAGTAPRTRVVTTALDFPTIGHQWLARAPLGVELVIVPSPDGLTVPLDAFAEAIDERTALVATGHVYFTTGALNELRPLADLCHDRGALLLVDAYQATGIVPTDVAATGVDVYVSGNAEVAVRRARNGVRLGAAGAARGAASDDDRLVQQRPSVRLRRRRARARPRRAAHTSWERRRCRRQPSRAVGWSWCARSAWSGWVSERVTSATCSSASPTMPGWS